VAASKVREEIMRRIILAFALAGILGVPAKADETLKFRTVQYTTSLESDSFRAALSQA
jgi:hypothetical protein